MARSAAEQLGTPCDPSAGDDCIGTAHRWPRLLADLQEHGYPETTALTYCTTPGCDYTLRGYWGDTITHHDDGTHTVEQLPKEDTPDE